ncbi:hypothetical protein [Nocardia tengchongensis]|uniref:hypothetical protein n=1 Tax=Nocardia tengchongensis TaxID=2055889 RepID=UPI0036674B6F
MEVPSRLSVQQRTLLLLVIAARNVGVADVAGAVQSVVRTPLSRGTIDALIQLLVLVGHQPGDPAPPVFAEVEALLAARDSDEGARSTE